MRRALAWTAGIVGIAAFARLLRRRRPETAELEQPAPDPAEELRRALADSRGPEAASEEVPAVASDATVDDRRADVHARGEEAIARMRGDDDTG